MLRREKQLMRLEKISQTSSPSPNRDIDKEPTTPSRLHPLAITPILYSKHSSNPPEDKTSKIQSLQEEIMQRKHKLNLLEQAFSQRLEANHLNVGQLMTKIISGVILLGQNNSQFKYKTLRVLKKGKKGVLKWVLGWIRALFGLIKMVLSQKLI